MQDFQKIIEKIYGEKDMVTNTALFFGALFSIIFYLNFHDIYVAIALFIGVFAFFKVVLVFFINKARISNVHKEILKSFSDTEIITIKTFIDLGTCFIALADLRQGKFLINEIGLNSLVNRGIVSFIDSTDGPSGFMLQEEIYKEYLKK